MEVFSLRRNFIVGNAMEMFEIEGGQKLFGTVRLKGAKNSVLPLLSASILTDEKVTLCDCPHISDVENMMKILQHLGVNVERRGDSISTSGRISNDTIPEHLAKEMRSSVFLLGSMLAVIGSARTYFPGGCDIGLRPIDLHIDGLKQLGVEFDFDKENLQSRAKNLKGADILLAKSSVGATENLILAATLAKGKTYIRNAAKEPEIVDLCYLLQKMGAKIRGEGTSVIEIEGVEGLHGATYTPIGDRIVCGTLLTAVAMTGGEVDIVGANEQHIASLTSKLKNSTCKIETKYAITHIESFGAPSCVRQVETAPYPGFPTDMQAQLVSLLTIADGNSLVCERVFENRFAYATELQKMGADITIVHNIASINGVRHLTGADVFATDLRGGSALVLAGLVAVGKTKVFNVSHIDRGYENFETMLSRLGANIKRKKE